jgi:hypothetical protein
MKNYSEDKVAERFQQWRSKNSIVVGDATMVISALRELEEDRLAARRQVLLLDLLRLYTADRLWKQGKRGFKRWSDEADSLAIRMRSVADDYRRLFPAFAEELATELYMTAENVASASNTERRMGDAQLYTRAFGRMWFLVMASELVRTGTKRGGPHYRELADLVSGISGREEDTEDKETQNVRKQVSRFIERNPVAVGERCVNSSV